MTINLSFTLRTYVHLMISINHYSNGVTDKRESRALHNVGAKSKTTPFLIEFTLPVGGLNIKQVYRAGEGKNVNILSNTEKAGSKQEAFSNNSS